MARAICVPSPRLLIPQPPSFFHTSTTVIANISHCGSVVDAIDFYCGYGGSAQGIIAAGADIKAAANHNQRAIECYSANYPTAKTYRADLVDPDCGFGHKVKFVGHKVKFVGHKMRILSVIK